MSISNSKRARETSERDDIPVKEERDQHTVELLRAERGECDWPHKVYEIYWPLAQAGCFAPTDPSDTALTVRELAT